ncbi:MAG TPA: hypothetical protein PLB89_11575 [Flavobacteriales bacterium]|nr:hypothetical protein [Flavobacteriales bacterium]
MTTLPFLASLLLTVQNAPSNAGTVSGGAGFSAALLDATTASELLEDKDCAGIRFYSAMEKDAASATVMAVGIDDHGAELTAGFFGRPYKLCVNGPVVGKARELSRSKAEEAITLIKTSGNTNFSASFSRTDLQAMLDKEGCVALLVTPDEASGSVSMRVAAVGTDGSKTMELGSGEGYEKVCGDPCPAFCGPTGNYLQTAK